MIKTNDNKESQNVSRTWGPIPPDILEGILNGDESAFAEYYVGVRSSLVAYVTKLIGDPEEAVNIVHDALIKLWEERDQLKQLTGGYIYTIATRDSLDLLRKRQVHERYVDEQMHDQDTESLAADQQMMYDELMTQYQAIVGNMPAQRRKVFEMSRHEGLTYNEIADRLGISYNTVMEHMRMALKDLKNSLAGVLMFFFL